MKNLQIAVSRIGQACKCDLLVNLRTSQKSEDTFYEELPQKGAVKSSFYKMEEENMGRQFGSFFNFNKSQQKYNKRVQ